MKVIKAPNLTELIHVYLNNKFSRNELLINVHNSLCKYSGIYPHNHIYDITELDTHFANISADKLIRDYELGLGDVDNAKFWKFNEKNPRVIDFFSSLDALSKNNVINLWDISNALNVSRDKEIFSQIPYLTEFLNSTLTNYGKCDNVEYCLFK